MIKKILVFCFVLCVSVNAFAGLKDIAKIGADAVVEEGTTVGDVAVIFGDLTVNGTANDVAVVGGDLNVGPTGRILGDTAVIFGKISKAPGAEIIGNVVENSFGKTFRHNLVFPILGFCTLGLFGLMILLTFFVILLITHLLTKQVGNASFYVQMHPWKSLLYGFCASLFILPVTLLLIISILGIPLIPLYLIAVFAASLFGYTAMCQLIGLKLFKVIKCPNQPMLLEVVAGFIILCILLMVPYFFLVPFISWIIKTLVWMTGLGATLATKFGRKW